MGLASYSERLQSIDFKQSLIILRPFSIFQYPVHTRNVPQFTAETNHKRTTSWDPTNELIHHLEWAKYILWKNTTGITFYSMASIQEILGVEQPKYWKTLHSCLSTLQRVPPQEKLAQSHMQQLEKICETSCLSLWFNMWILNLHLKSSLSQNCLQVKV